jgi:hypothetical protein
MVTGLLWVVDNHPFRRNLGAGQYTDHGVAPYQKLIDYVRGKSGRSAGVVWSAPEADNRFSVEGVSLCCASYLHDVLASFGHNGMAGLYGDAVTALRSGGEWDEMLLEYCRGKRRTRPVIVGELDYHGRKRRIDMYQTVVRVAKKNGESIVKAILDGRSYAYARPTGYGLELVDAFLESGREKARPGETSRSCSTSEPLRVFIEVTPSGIPPKSQLGTLVVIANGKTIREKSFSKKSRFSFKLSSKSLFDDDISLAYIRFDITYGNARIVTNPIFVKPTK